MTVPRRKGAGPLDYQSSHLVVSIHLQDDRKSQVVQTLEMNLQSSFDKFKTKTLEGKEVGRWT